MANINIINELLDDAKNLLEERKEYNKQQLKSAHEFNVFSILGLERREVKTHSAFIYNLINPAGTHGQGDIFLKSFIENVLKLPKLAFNTKNLYVNREEQFDDGRIDFIIQGNNFYVAIEMKVDASDQLAQLKRYFEHAKAHSSTAYVYYLTLYGKEAASYSDQGIEYERISFKKEIVSWINDCIATIAGKNLNNLLIPLVQYREIIKVITAEYEEDMKLIEIINGREKYEAAIVVKDAILEFQGAFLKEFFDKLKKFMIGKINKMEPNCKNVNTDDNYDKALADFYKSSVKTYPKIMIPIKVVGKDANLTEGKRILYFVGEIDWNFYCMLSLRDENGQVLNKKDADGCEEFKKIKEKLKNNYEIRTDNAWKFVGYQKGKDNNLDFHSFNTNLINMISNNTSVGNLIDDKKMKEVCENVYSSYKEICDAIESC